MGPKAGAIPAAILGAICLLVLCPAATLALDAPRPAALKPVDATGYEALLKEHSGKTVLVNFWATWCEPCRHEMPFLAALAERYRQRGFRLVTISADDEDDLPRAEQFLRASGVPFPAYYKQADDDSAFIDAIDPKWSGALPATFLYDAQGRRVARFIGETELDVLEEAVVKALDAARSQADHRRSSNRAAYNSGR
jgi:thiol-disulfide isomerase/thioredoxin